MTCCLSSAAQLVSVVGVVLLAVVGAWGSAVATAEVTTSSPASLDCWDAASRPNYLSVLCSRGDFGEVIAHMSPGDGHHTPGGRAAREYGGTD